MPYPSHSPVQGSMQHADHNFVVSTVPQTRQCVTPRPPSPVQTSASTFHSPSGESCSSLYSLATSHSLIRHTRDSLRSMTIPKFPSASAWTHDNPKCRCRLVVLPILQYRTIKSSHPPMILIVHVGPIGPPNHDNVQFTLSFLKHCIGAIKFTWQSHIGKTSSV
jgi:hypothetical protein